jgi:hypothetical protein
MHAYMQMDVEKTFQKPFLGIKGASKREHVNI